MFNTSKHIENIFSHFNKISFCSVISNKVSFKKFISSIFVIFLTLIFEIDCSLLEIKSQR